MEGALFLKICDELVSEKKPPMFMFALHNEPLLDKRIFALVKHLKTQSPGTYCILPTNAELLDTFSLREIKASGVSQLNINLSAHSREVYERTHNGLDYERVIANINSLVSDEILRQKVQIMFVQNQENARELPEAVAYWKQKGVRTKVIPLNNRAGNLDTYAQLNLKESGYPGPRRLRTWKGLMARTRRWLGCELPFYQMDILFDGDVIICSCDWKRSIVVGNLKDSSLRAIWNSARMNEIRKLLLRKRYEQLLPCIDCSFVK